jgi:hypothetical protein
MWLKRCLSLRALLLLIAVAAVFAGFRFPMWTIYLYSNQYPDSIGMAIYAHKVTDPPDIHEMDGGLSELNILNHYIGMRQIKTETMAEFKWIPAGFILAGLLLLLSIFITQRKMIIAAMGFFALISAAGVANLIYRLYSFGHDLDPKAPIKVESFMPGIYGEHTLAQFTTYSYFEWGTFLPVIAFLLGFLVLVFDLYGKKIPLVRKVWGLG